MTSARFRNRTISATIRTMPDSLVKSDRSLTWSDHGENQPQKNHNCAPAHSLKIPALEKANIRPANISKVTITDHKYEH